MIRNLIFTALIFNLLGSLAQAQDRPVIYGLKMSFSTDSVSQVSVLSIQMKMKRIESLSGLQVELGVDSLSWGLYSKSVFITQSAGNRYLEVDNAKQFISGSLATIQFVVPVEVARTARYARVYGMPQMSTGAEILYFMF